MKNHTDLPQSKILAEFLPIESADMTLVIDLSGKHLIGIPYIKEHEDLEELRKQFGKIESQEFPCWSLAALSEFILPYIADDDGNNYKFYLSKDGLDRWIAYYKSDDVSIHICEESDNMIDVILEMVYWLKKEEYI